MEGTKTEDAGDILQENTSLDVTSKLFSYSFGQRTPPLTELIKNILIRYPDGGQILKELIQNADDAGATEVKFFYDSKSFGSTSLFSPELRIFQGAALYCYNNATFKEEDWEGIQNLMRSNKKEDPLKVGQFGIGFNSVYHITDLPGIVSGEYVGFLDPHEQYFGKGESGKRFLIRDGLLRGNLKDQFLPFHDVFRCDLINERPYTNTLFRFPLRKISSHLSDKEYTAAMIDNLFDSLREEASVILLFLKSVQSISIYERKNNDDIECIFKVEVSQDTQEDVENKRQRLLVEAKKSSCVPESTFTTINIDVKRSSVKNTFRWLVVNQLGSTDKRILELSTKLHLLPWVGLAFPLNHEVSHEGRIFCFLPLPPDVECQTGLPVHVHGYFGLTDNRRGLTWPGAECQHNETAEWNKLLLTKIGSEVYYKMIRALITNQLTTGLNSQQQSRLVYYLLPVLERVRDHWQCILGPLFQKLQDQKLFYAEHAFGNSLVQLNEGILDRMQELGAEAEIRQAVMRILLTSQMIITNLPRHVLEIVAKYFRPPVIITPLLVRGILKKTDVNKLSREEKLRILQYVLSDGKTSDLTQVPLLPLADHHFTTFRSNKHSSKPKVSVFVPSGNCTADLLPNMTHRFLDDRIPLEVKTKLHSIAASKSKTTKPTQLVRLTAQIVLENMRQCLPSEWCDCNSDKVLWKPGESNHPPHSWLEATWKWLNESFPGSLEHFQGIPLIPFNNYLGILSKNSKFIFAIDHLANVLPEVVSTFLTACGCTILPRLPSYIYHTEMNLYIASPTPADVLNVLSRLSPSFVHEKFIEGAHHANRAVFRDFMARLPNVLADSQRNILLCLPLFDTLQGTCTPVQVKPGVKLKAVSLEFTLPDGFQLSKGCLIILPTDTSTLKLLNILNVDILKPADVLVQYLFPYLDSTLAYNNHQVTVVMQWVLERMTIFRSQSSVFFEHLKGVPFVITKSGKREKPSELYDPNDHDLRQLLSGETNAFPTGVFAIDDAICKLKLLGLKTRKTLTVHDLFKFASTISSSSVSSESVGKVKAMVEILANEPRYLEQSPALKLQLWQVKWIPCAQTAPAKYPDFMPWYKSTVFFAPSEILSSSKAQLIGSSMPTLGITMNSQLQKELAIASDPPVPSVVAHLKVAINSWKSLESTSTMLTARFQEMITDIYIFLAQFPSQTVAHCLRAANVEYWIWHGNGFCAPTNVAFSKDFSLDLRPRLFLLQNEFTKNRTLTNFFREHGVQEKFSNEDILSVLYEVKKKHATSEGNNACEVQQDLYVCCAILKWVVRDGKVLSMKLQRKVFVPVQSSRDVLILEPCTECTFCDRKWLRQGGSEVDITDDYKIVHDSIPEKVSRLLGVPPLSTCLLSAETLGFEQTGPYESITNRLKTILQEYKEGVGIFKELVQNADDAGATEVSFLVDWRCGPKEKLLSPNMADCQGPALWAYNNAEFSDEDFDNINKLAGATKIESLDKIGRFGLGFNSVYHLTDVPSFVSREYFVVFDPNVNHLQSHIKDKSRPGLRINLADNPKPLAAFEHQFQPYDGVFNCNTQVREVGKFYCDGTLFRFPFRTLNEANKSEICKSVYDKEKVEGIVNSLRESSALLLLYTQHVKEVKLFEIKDGSVPTTMQPVLSISKETPKILRSSNVSCTLPFIEECSRWWRKKLELPNSSLVGPSRCELVSVTTKEMPSHLIDNTQESTKHQLWLITSCVGSNSSVALSSKAGLHRGLLPCAGAAAQLMDVPAEQSGAWSVEGEAFCFLPLSIPTGFPVHVNGYFALTSNRRGIWERTTSRQSQQIEVQWNECLIEDALSNAYVQLLEDIKNLCRSDTTKDPYKLWPVYDTLNHSSTWGRLVKRFYAQLVEESMSLWCSDGKWLSIEDGYVLDEKLGSIPEVVETLKLLGQVLFDIPARVRSSFKKAGQGEALKRRTLNMRTFLGDLFFPNIKDIPQQIRDPVICHVLDLVLNGDDERFSEFFESYRCITCSNDGNQLAMASELVNPVGPVAELFSPQENRFPVGDHFLTERRMYTLESLGMVKDKLSWREICGRAESVKRVAKESYEMGRKRARDLIKYLTDNVENLPKIEEKPLTTLRSTEFLPVLSTPPAGYDLPWKGSEVSKKQYFAPNDVFLFSERYLIGSCSPIVDDSNATGCGKLGHSVKGLLGFRNHSPNVEQVLQQLDTAIKYSLEQSRHQEIKKNTVELVCNTVYKYFNDLITGASTSDFRQQKGVLAAAQWLLNKLKQRSWIFIKGTFVSSERVAWSWSGNGSPYLYGLPYEYLGKYDKLLSCSGVKKSFDENDFLKALLEFKDSKMGSPLTNEELKLAICFLSELKDESKFTSHVGQIPLPDTKRLFCKSEKLTINMTIWLKDRGDARYVHQDIPPHHALTLGAKSLHSRRLKKYSNTIGSSFGQQEELTDRLENILKSYPCDYGILKELVQNADDAGATEIHFIYDKRNLPNKSVVQEHAEEIQGPALCVYNNRPFSDKDLEGIQKIGIGSKRDDPEKTGQYGIGFNAVYHLTDCPSFLSNDDTLCFLDPHCRYAPEATPESPGEQFRPIDEEFKEDYKDVLLGYLGDYFELKSATMFRLPLRTRERSTKSLISNVHPDMYMMQPLLTAFKVDARKVLLFLNHIKKLTLSEINERGELRLIYQVDAQLDESSEQQRQNLSNFMNKYKDQPTNQVPWNGITYPLTLTDSQKVVQTWLVHQSCGTEQGIDTENTEINGHSYGLFPRGGVAALVSSNQPSHIKPTYVAYCFLPLPVTTALPVHVNGHFALDPSRRNLWNGTNPEDVLTKWNDFMKRRVLAPGYATLICEAIKFIPNSETRTENGTVYSFSNLTNAQLGLNWFHKLFPHSSQDSTWNILACEMYRLLEARRAAVLPVILPNKVQEVTVASSQSQQGLQEDIPHAIRKWLPVQDAFFLKEKDRADKTKQSLRDVLLQINFPLLILSPSQIHTSFEKAEVFSNVLNPRSVVDFLVRKFSSQSSICTIGQLPSPIADTNVHSVGFLLALIGYCKEDNDFPALLEDLPLLFTADGQLRIFSSNYVVYRSYYSDLFPAQAHNFVHPDLIYKLPEIKDIAAPPVMKHFTVTALAEFFPNVFPPNIKGSTDHISWTFFDTGPLSKKWFQRLWTFLEKYVNPEEDEKEVSLHILGEWPIIPTTNGKLVTINCGKTVLDAMQRKMETSQRRCIREILMKLDCPTLNTKITLKKPTDSFRSSHYAFSGTFLPETYIDDGKTHVTDRYVAHPHSVSDTLHVLEYMRKTSLLDTSKISHPDIQKLLSFFQDDLRNLQPREKFIEILRELPFYKAINGDHFSLSQYSYSAVIPGGVPTEEVAKLQRHTGCLFLQIGTDLKELYKTLGVAIENSHSEFYTKYIIPSFKIFCRESQIQYLTHIRDFVLPDMGGKRDREEKERFVKFLIASPCIPDEHGNLYHAGEFYDPRNKVFTNMLNENMFPPSAFKEEDWLEFLSLIGLKTDVKENMFLEFCKEVAMVANISREDKSNAKKSQVLVEYLLESEHLRSETFLIEVSNIKFVVSQKVEPHLASLHRQYRCNTEDEEPPFIKFLDAVPWNQRVLAWTSADLLPPWPQINSQLIQYVGIQEIPSVNTVVNHLHNISCVLSEISRKDEVLPQSSLLEQTIVSIYQFLESARSCKTKEISDSCGHECKTIGRLLKNISCVLVEDGKVLVKGDQLSFRLKNEKQYIPFLYIVPREYGPYEHLLKRLGATEQMTSIQLANVLKSIKNQCQDDKMNPNFSPKACGAMGDLFSCVYRESNCGKKPSMLSDLAELFLPSDGGLLIRSSELVCQIPPRLQEKVKELKLRVLFPLEKCGLTREKENDYLNALPPNLRPRPLSSIFKEVLDPSCLDDICPISQENLSCDFIERYKLILQSNEFQQGIVRLLKHQKNSNELNEKEIERSSTFNPGKLVVRCMRSVRVHLVDVRTETLLENSSRNRPCYVVNENHLWTLFIQHDDGGRQHAALPKCVDKILNWGLTDPACMLAVSQMLHCDLPSQIPSVLNELDIEHDFGEEELKLGQEVPVVFHHLMQQNPVFIFHDGEIIAYGIETNATSKEGLLESEDTTSIKYVLAMVICCTERRDSGTGSYDFTAQYEIDIGHKKIIVSVLDLYKFYQNDFLENINRDMVSYDENTNRIPTSLTEAKREILEAIRAAWKLSHALRRKAIRRLYLQWHPDKNSDNVEFATEMMQFLLSEIKKKEREEAGPTSDGDPYGFDGLFRSCNRRARRDRETFQNFQNNYGTGSRPTFSSASEFTIPNPSESLRWLKQAKCDLEAAEYLLFSLQQFYAWICFVSQQIVEKCLKAVLYARCGLNHDQLHTHDVYRLANDVCRMKDTPVEIVDLALVVGNYYLSTRYPNRHPGSIIPSDAFNREQSQKAVTAAKRLLRLVEILMRR